MQRPLRDIAKVLRSKNAGPFKVTIDIFFANEEDFDLVESSGVLHADAVADAYGLRLDEVSGPYFQRAALGAKVTIIKRSSAQNPFCSDLLGASQHIPIADMLVETAV
jgi:hypothetical protein